MHRRAWTGIAMGWLMVPVGSGSLAAQQSQIDAEPTTTADSASGSRNALVPLPAVFYTPETKLAFGGVVTYYMYGAAQETERILPSTISAAVVYTTRNQLLAFAGTELFLDGDRLRVRAGGGYSKFPTKFWGIGNETPDSLEEDYTPRTASFDGEVQWRAAPGWYVGGVTQFAYRELAEVAPGGMLETGAVPGTADGRVIGIGALITRDTRNNSVYPSSGSYHQLRATWYDGFFASQYDFGAYSLDLRTYLSPWSRHVLALRVLGQATSGAPPFDLLPQLGGEVLLRGYYQGRFRDRHLLAGQLEYRAPIWWRLGAVAFVSGGQVARGLDAFRWGGFKASAGGGLRILLDPESGLNIRADYGWGFDVGSGGFYVSIGEAF